MRGARRVSGILLLDKPSGPGSNAALQRVRRVYRADKAGHTGALDPLASGLLPICFGEATKLAGLMLGGDKGYRVTVRLGVRTDTLDAEGVAVESLPVPALTRDDVEQTLTAFRGAQMQVPPMYSALKRNGRPLYELARRGEIVDRPSRAIRVSRLEIVVLELPLITLDCDVSSGTYVRSLVDDIGQTLGCGAHVATLRRTWAAPFVSHSMHTLDEIEKADVERLDSLLLPMESGVAHLPRIDLDDAAAIRFRHGQAMPTQVQADPVAVFAAGRLIAIGVARDGTLRTSRGIVGDGLGGLDGSVW